MEGSQDNAEKTLKKRKSKRSTRSTDERSSKIKSRKDDKKRDKELPPNSPSPDSSLDEMELLNTQPTINNNNNNKEEGNEKKRKRKRSSENESNKSKIVSSLLAQSDVTVTVNEKKKNINIRSSISLIKSTSNSKPNLFMKRGFLQFFNDEIVTDLVLRFGCANKEYNVHRLIVAHSSCVLYRLLQENPSLKQIEIFTDEVIEDRVSDYVVGYMYTGSILFTENNCAALLSLADKYEMLDLMRKAVEYITDNIERENAIKMLKKALNKDLHRMIEKCIDVIARNFCYIYNSDYTFLPPILFQKILSHPKLNIQTEYELYNEILRYIEGHKEPLTSDQVHMLMENVRFCWFSLKEIDEVYAKGLVSNDLLISALLMKMDRNEIKFNSNHIENQLSSIDCNDVRWQVRENHGITFNYKNLYKQDKNTLGKGILYWLATNGGRSKIVTNPSKSGLVSVMVSSVEKGEEFELVGNNCCEFWTKDVPSSWFSIQFLGERKVKPTSYVLRHGRQYRTDCLRTWDFQGSADGESWITLKRYIFS